MTKIYIPIRPNRSTSNIDEEEEEPDSKPFEIKS